MAKQMLVQTGAEEPELTIEQSLARYVSNADLSDVCFLVGEEREAIYAHRFLLAIESEVFKSMFYGDLKETKYKIEVPDLTPVGFRNMMKYFYTKKIEINLSEFCETYMAANKYIASALIRALSKYIKSLDVSTVCIVYDQLLKLNINDSLFDEVKLLVAARLSDACTSDSFKQIDENTLISILKLNRLNVSELELLKACLRWTDYKFGQQLISRPMQSRRQIFKPFKHLIRFGDLELEHFGSIAGIQNYLTIEEIGSVFLHHFQSCVPIQIDYQSPREACTVQVVKSIKTDEVHLVFLSTVHELKCSIRTDKAVLVSSIKTLMIAFSSKLEFEVYRDGIPLLLDCEITQECCPTSYTIDLNLVLQPDTNYELSFKFSIVNYLNTGSYNLRLGKTNEMTMKSDQSEVVFEPESDPGYHCIDTIKFAGPFE